MRAHFPKHIPECRRPSAPYRRLTVCCFCFFLYIKPGVLRDTTPIFSRWGDSVSKFFVKLAVTFAAIYLLAYLLPAVGVSFSYVLLSTLLIVLPAWAGDRMVLPHLSSLAAAALDGVYAFLVLWIAALLAPYSAVTFTFLTVAALAIFAFEYLFFHPWVFDLKDYKPRGARS